MSDGTLTAAVLLEKIQVERATIMQRYERHNGSNAWQELADGDEADRGLAATAFDFRQIENAADRGKLELLDEAIARIEADSFSFDACQAGDGCLGNGHIEHERLAILSWAKFCCACAAAKQKR